MIPFNIRSSNELFSPSRLSRFPSSDARHPSWRSIEYFFESYEREWSRKRSYNAVHNAKCRVVQFLPFRELCRVTGYSDIFFLKSLLYRRQFCSKNRRDWSSNVFRIRISVRLLFSSTLAFYDKNLKKTKRYFLIQLNDTCNFLSARFSRLILISRSLRIVRKIFHGRDLIKNNKLSDNSDAKETFLLFAYVALKRVQSFALRVLSQPSVLFDETRSTKRPKKRRRNGE